MVASVALLSLFERGIHNPKRRKFLIYKTETVAASERIVSGLRQLSNLEETLCEVNGLTFHSSFSLLLRTMP